MKMNTYVNESGYEIQATEKAYRLFYEKQGFKLKGKQVEEPKKKKSAAKKKTDKVASGKNEKAGKEAGDEKDGKEVENEEKDVNENAGAEEKKESPEKDGEQTA